ncbi:MAG: cephalosporin hydroxylase [Brachymonas sp.]|nr:cephalosporin hydroxylase [Brachymonas sp.]
MNPNEKFQAEAQENIKKLGSDQALHATTLDWINRSALNKYTYHFSSLGRPIIQYPQDMVAMQELIWAVKPDLIIETGIAHGGSLIMSASMLALLDMSEAIENNESLNPRQSKRKVLGIDIDIRQHNQTAILAHPMASRIHMIQGSSIAADTINQVKEFAKDYQKILVCLDSNHTHDHVLAELEAYAPLTSVGSYCVVFDTVIDDMPKSMFPDRSWGPGNNPKTALFEYIEDLEKNVNKTQDGRSLKFEIDKSVDNKLLITVAPDGYLKRVS